jgi:hypothetical protein
MNGCSNLEGALSSRRGRRGDCGSQEAWPRSLQTSLMKIPPHRIRVCALTGLFAVTVTLSQQSKRDGRQREQETHPGSPGANMEKSCTSRKTAGKNLRDTAVQERA